MKPVPHRGQVIFGLSITLIVNALSRVVVGPRRGVCRRHRIAVPAELCDT
ncbi:hypothetical protein RCH07_003856 [Arthrobacter sp. CG_A4]|nr:hypothetical protein [Arthrobacter sp. CG_A4]